MTGGDREGNPDTPKKPGLFRRLFGGGLSGGAGPGVGLPQAEPEGASIEPPAAPPGGGRDNNDDTLAAGDEADLAILNALALEDVAPDPLEREALSTAQSLAPELPLVEREERGWWTRLRGGLSRSSGSIKQGIIDVFSKRKLEASTLEDLEDVLIRADLGAAMASRISAAVGAGRYEKGIEPADVQAVMAREVESVLRKVAVPFVVNGSVRPFVIVVIGVNGSGKTTTIGKLAAKFIAEGKTVTLGAGDTFRAAAVAQLRIWGQRTGAAVISREQGADAAGLAYEAVVAARENGSHVLLIDTAGRLQNRAELMDELSKVLRVVRKVEPGAPHAVLLVLDATVGQNALSQVEIFSKIAGVTGLVMTKLDGTARGGILVAVAERFGLPVHFIGVGEGVDDLEPFAAGDFARVIAGLDREFT